MHSLTERVIKLQLPPFDTVSVLNFKLLLIKGILYGCKLLAVLEMPLIFMAIKVPLVIPVTNATYETEVLVVSTE